MIRVATDDDLPAMISLGTEFLVELGVEEPAKQAELVVRLVQGSEIGTILVLEQDHVTGLLGYTLGDHPITGRYSGMEIAWFVSKAERGRREALRLPLVAQQLAKRQGALDFYLAVRQDRLGLFLERQGYTATDRTYVIRLEDTPG